MDVRTTRFGTVQVAEDRLISFPKGLLGFSHCTRFCLLQPADDAAFFWLQSLDEPALAFIVTDPAMFVPEYSVPIRPEQMGELKLNTLDDAQVLVICNKIDHAITGNLQGPLVVNTVTRAGEQFVLAEKRWTTRHTLMTLAQQAPAMSA